MIYTTEIRATKSRGPDACLFQSPPLANVYRIARPEQHVENKGRVFYSRKVVPVVSAMSISMVQMAPRGRRVGAVGRRVKARPVPATYTTRRGPGQARSRSGRGLGGTGRGRVDGGDEGGGGGGEKGRHGAWWTRLERHAGGGGRIEKEEESPGRESKRIVGAR